MGATRTDFCLEGPSGGGHADQTGDVNLKTLEDRVYTFP
jgi:hypothetical protein